MKPVKRGIKVWVLANRNGYFWNMQVHNKYLTQISVTTCDRFTLENRQLQRKALYFYLYFCLFVYNVL